MRRCSAQREIDLVPAESANGSSFTRLDSCTEVVATTELTLVVLCMISTDEWELVSVSTQRKRSAQRRTFVEIVAIATARLSSNTTDRLVVQVLGKVVVVDAAQRNSFNIASGRVPSCIAAEVAFSFDRVVLIIQAVLVAMSFAVLGLKEVSVLAVVGEDQSDAKTEDELRRA